MGIRIRQYMRQVVEDHRDPLCGEIDITGLAEDAADEFDLYDENDEPQERLFDLAFEIYEADERRKTGRISNAIGGIVTATDDCLRG